jgi:hypothetical protein
MEHRIIFAVPKIVGQSFEDAEEIVQEQINLIREGKIDNSFLREQKRL